METLGHDMRKQDEPGTFPCASADPALGEFGSLLSEIEQEAVPERLLALARQLQAALVEHRKRRQDMAEATEA